MPPKRPATSVANANSPKRVKKVMTLQEKVKVLDMLKEGRSNVAVGRHFGVNESTIRSIKKNEAAIRSNVNTNVSHFAKTASVIRDKNIVRMESALILWITDCRKKNVPLDSNVIRQKAKKLYSNFKRVHEEELQSETSTSMEAEEFQASKGWFDRFQKRFKLKSVSLHGESASADHASAAAYPEQLRQLMEAKGYRPEQVFNMDETGLYWKKLPQRTYIMKEEARAPGFKAQKDRVTLLMCGNAAGFMIKPGLIYRSANPRALKKKRKESLPVFWMHNQKAWITKSLTEKWFHECFVPGAKDYLESKGIPFKVLLIMDNASGHHVDLSCEGVEIEFLPPNTTALIQPMDQGVIRAFKALYTRNSLQHLVDAMDHDQNFSLKDYWRDFTIANCLQTIQTSLQEMKPATLNACWKKLLPEVVDDHEAFSPDEIHHEAVDKAVKLAKILGGEGFDDVTADELNDLIDAHSAPLTDDDLMDLTKSPSAEEEENDTATENVMEEDEGLSLERLVKILNAAKDLQGLIESWDPCMVRSMQSQNTIAAGIQVYKALFTTMKKERQQLKITAFFTSSASEIIPPPPTDVLDNH